MNKKGLCTIIKSTIDLPRCECSVFLAQAPVSSTTTLIRQWIIVQGKCVKTTDQPFRNVIHHLLTEFTELIHYLTGNIPLKWRSSDEIKHFWNKTTFLISSCCPKKRKRYSLYNDAYIKIDKSTNYCLRKNTKFHADKSKWFRSINLEYWLNKGGLLSSRQLVQCGRNWKVRNLYLTCMHGKP